MAIIVRNETEAEALRDFLNHVIDDLESVADLYDFTYGDDIDDYISETVDVIKGYRDRIEEHNMAPDRINDVILKLYKEGKTAEEIANTGIARLKTVKRVIKMRG